MRLLIVSASLLFFVSPAYSQSRQDTAHAYITQAYEINKQLREYAVSRGLIPALIDDEFIRKKEAEEDAFTLWLALGFDRKAGLIEEYKERLARKGIIVRKPSSYYADQMNLILLAKLESAPDIEDVRREGIEPVFKGIALMENDFDDRSKDISSMRKFLGDEAFTGYITRFPVKYAHLLNARGQVKEEGSACVFDAECEAADCSMYNEPGQNRYTPYCVENECRCAQAR